LKKPTRNDVAQSLGQPVLAEMSDGLRRTKRNLLLVSSIVGFASAAEIKVTQAGFLGFQFTNPTQWWLDVFMLSLVAYLLVQFAWQTFDYIMQTRLRVTGTRVSHVTAAKFAGPGGDYPDDPNQSTLYNWWLESSGKQEGFREAVKTLDDVASSLRDIAKGPAEDMSQSPQGIVRQADSIKTAAGTLRNQLVAWEKAISSERIPESLERFDKWFQLFPRSQKWRLWLLDLALPFFTGVAAILLVLTRVVCG
jgi:hypothetical protein